MHVQTNIEIMAVYSENNMKPLNNFHGQTAERFGVKVLCFAPLQCGHWVSSSWCRM